MLGEEDDLADVAGELRGVVGRQPGLRLADPAHHAEHVLAVGRARGVLALPRRHPAYELVVDPVDEGGFPLPEVDPLVEPVEPLEVVT